MLMSSFAQKAGDAVDISALSHEDVQRLVHELQVRQVELQMQNEELRQTQLALEESRANYSDLYDSAPVGYVTVNEKGLILEANLTAVSLLGVERQALINKPLSRFVRKELGDAYYLHLRQVFETQSGQTCEIELVRKDGTPFHAQLESVAVQDENGQFNRCRTIVMDITDRKQAEQAILTSEQKYRALFEESFDGLFITSPEGRILDMNKKGVEMFGYGTKEEILSLDLERDVYSHPPDRKRILSMVNAQGSAEYEVVVKKKSGDEMITHCALIAGRDEQGAITSYRGIIRDITERKRAEEKLRQSENRFRSMFQNHDAVMLLIEPETGQIIDANLSAQRFYGYQLPEMLGMSIQQINTLSSDEIARERQKALSRECNHFIFPHRLANGEVRTVEVHSSPIELEGQRILFSIVHDITLRKQAEEALRESVQRYRAVVDNIGIGISLLSPNLEIVEVNKVFRDSFPHIRAGCGQICYEQYNDPPRSGPCSYCPSVLAIQDGEVHEAITETPAGSEIRHYRLVSSPIKDSDGKVQSVIEMVEDITERVQAEQERLANLQFFENMDRISRAIQGSSDLEQMMSDVLDTALSIFDCDRAWLVYPCDPEANFWKMPMESTKPEYPGAFALGVEIPTTEDVAWSFRESLASKDPVTFGPTSGRPIPPVASAHFGFQSVIKMALHPKVGKPWEFGLHQCSYQRVWTQEEERLFREIGRRLEDSLSVLLAHHNLRESEDKFKHVFQSANVGKSVTLLTGEITVNKAFCSMLGYTEDELRNKTWQELTAPEDIGTVQELLDLLVTGEKDSVRFNKRYLHHNGSYVWGDASVAIRRDLEGKPLHFITTVVDITERMEAENRLRLNEARLQSLHDIAQFRAESTQDLLDFALNEAIKLTGSRVGYIYHYDEECRLFELNTWSKEVMKGCEVAEPQTLYELDKTGIWGEAVRQRRPIIVNDFQVPNPLKKGYPEGHVELSTFMTIPVFAGERIVAVIGMGNKDSGYDENDVRQLSLLMDSVWRITEAKRFEAQQRRLATAVEHAAEGVMITDIDGTIEYVNDACVQMTGYEKEELIGRNPRILRSGEQEEAFYQEFWRTIASGRVWTGRIVNRKNDGALYTAELTVSPVRNSSGIVVNFVALARDITQHLELSKQLFQAQKMEAVGTLAGGVAHDFNNVLQVGLGFSELILGDPALPQHYRSDLQKIYESAKRGADLVQRLLTFSRKTEIEPRPLNLNSLITDLQKMLFRTLPKMIAIQLFLNRELSSINADKTQMDQVIMNLAVNARDAMPDGGNLIFETSDVVLDEEYAGTHVAAKPGPHVLLTVTDTGSGMDKDTLEHIFEPFYTTKGVGEGTGLGLAMVHGIVQQHGGHIRCYSEPGHGTTFKIYFPALLSEEREEETVERPMPQGGSETILLVDDEELIRDLGSRILEKAGYNVITASNGRQAVETYEQRRGEIALVLLDLMMPEMGGKQCLEVLLGMNPSVKVIITSGYSASGPTKEALEAGAKGFVNKPYDMRQVREVVRQVLDAE